MTIFEGDVGIAWLSVLPLPFSSIKFIVAIVVVGLTAARENFSKTLQWAEDREVTEETVGGGVAGRSQWNVTENRWQNLLRIKPSLEPRGAVPALFLDLIQANANGEGCRRLLERGRLPLRTPTSQRCLPHGKKVIGLHPSVRYAYRGRTQTRGYRSS
jgi:hypothetical protein